MEDGVIGRDAKQPETSKAERERPTAEAIKKGMALVQLRMDLLRDPADVLGKWSGTGNGRYERWCEDYFFKLVNTVARQTGADPEQVADKRRRTPQQERLWLKVEFGERLNRLEAFLKSAYMDALNTLEPLEGVYEDPRELPRKGDDSDPVDGSVSVKEQAALYFFALRDDLDPTEPRGLTPEQKEELRGIYARLDALYGKRYDDGLDVDDDAILYAFIEREAPVSETAASIAEKLPLVQGIHPGTHTIPNNALMNALQQKPAINAGAFDLVVSNKRRGRKEITAYTMISFDPGDTDITITDAHLSEYERQVSDAIVSLWLEADKRGMPPVFTTDMIFRAMPGGGDKLSPRQREKITETIEKFRRLHITVDATEEMRKRRVISQDAIYKIDNFYLSATHAKYRVKRGGQIVDAYRIDAEPIILTYCEMTRQYLTVPAKYLAIRKVKDGGVSDELVRMTPDRQCMVGYMARRIRVMERDRNNGKVRQSNVILFRTLFKEVGIEAKSRKQIRRNLDFCFNTLEFWKAVGFIKGYSRQQEEGRRNSPVTGVAIELNTRDAG